MRSDDVRESSMAESRKLLIDGPAGKLEAVVRVARPARAARRSTTTSSNPPVVRASLPFPQV